MHCKHGELSLISQKSHEKGKTKQKTPSRTGIVMQGQAGLWGHRPSSAAYFTSDRLTRGLALKIGRWYLGETAEVIL